MKNINILKDLKTLNKLHASSVESHTTNNGIVDFACDNAGYVDNVVIEGKTLVNLSDLAFINDPIGDNITRTQFSNKNRCTNGEYTLINFADIPIFFTILNISTQMYTRGVFVDGRTSVVERLNEDESIYGVDFNLVDGWQQGDTSIFKPSLFMVLEGDHTNKPITYFEGLKSVGQGNKIEVLTYPTNNENLITSDVTLHGDYYISWGTGELVSWVDSSEKYYATDYIEVEPNTEYIFANINKNIAYYDANKTFIPMPLSEGYSEKKCTYFYNTSPSNAKYVRLSIKDMYIGKPYMAKGKYICDKKQISTTLRSLPNGVKDTIEKRGNKYVKVQRCGEHTYNGEDFYYYASNDTIHHAQINLNNIKTYADTNIPNAISNLIPHQSNVIGAHSKVFISDSKINIVLPTLSYTDEDSIKNYLKDNNFTVVYELATPIITELPNFNPQTYKGENALIVNSGAIQCDASFDVYEGIRSELDVIKDKVSSLDDYESGYEFSNEVIYLNGTLKPGFAETPYIVRIGKICILHCAIGNDAPQRGMHVLKLPSFAKPKDHHRCAGRAKINDETINPILVDYDITLDNTVQIWTTHETTKLNEMYIHMIWEVE